MKYFCELSKCSAACTINLSSDQFTTQFMKLVNYVHKCQQLYTKYKAIPENIVSLLPSGLLQVRSMNNNANGNKRVIIFPV